MLANLNQADVPLVTKQRTIRELAVLCEKHSVPCGRSEHLAGLLDALGRNKLLAMEFWSLVARVTDREPAAATDDSLLAAIVEAVAGQTLTEANSSGSTERLLVRKFANMLAGEDINTPLAPGPFSAAREVAAQATMQPEPGPLFAPSEKPRLVLRPEPEILPEPPAAAAVESTAKPDSQRTPELEQLRSVHDDDPQITIPLSAYAEDAKPSMAPRLVAAAVLFAAIGAGVFALHRNPTLLTRAGKTIQPSAVPSASHTETPGSTLEQTVPASGPSPSPESPPPVAVTAPAPLRGSPTAAASPERDRIAVNEPGVPQVVVPEELMKQNLVSSRVPVVPEGGDPHGVVVLDAVITSRGTVARLHATQGDPALRRAAIDAASAWRYRPYLVNGTPTDVSTTITVDFAGND